MQVQPERGKPVRSEHAGGSANSEAVFSGLRAARKRVPGQVRRLVH